LWQVVTGPVRYGPGMQRATLAVGPLSVWWGRVGGRELGEECGAWRQPVVEQGEPGGEFGCVGGKWHKGHESGQGTAAPDVLHHSFSPAGPTAAVPQSARQTDTAPYSCHPCQWWPGIECPSTSARALASSQCDLTRQRRETYRTVDAVLLDSHPLKSPAPIRCR